MKRAWQNLYLFGFKPLRGVPPEVRAWVAHAARGGRTRRRVWWALTSIAALLLLAVQVAASSAIEHLLLWDEWPQDFGSVLEDVLDSGYLGAYAIGWVIAAAATVVELVILRLLWLRQGAKRVLARRERCFECGQGLSGVPIMGADAVRCPECGAFIPAVAAWGEVIRTAPDRATFSPAENLVRVFWTRRRLVLAGKVCAALVLLGALAYGAWWGVREVGIRRQAAIARKERPNLDELNERILTRKPALQPDQVYVGDAVRNVLARYDTLVQQFKDKELASIAGAQSMHIDADWACREPHGDESQEERLRDYYSTKLMDYLQTTGLYKDVDDLTQTAKWLDKLVVPVDEPQGPTSELSDLRRVARISTARMRIARVASDADEFRRAGLSICAIIETAATGPHTIDWLVADSHEKSLLRELRAVLLSSPSPEMLQAVDQIAANLPPVDPIAAFENAHVILLDSVCWFFSEPSRVRKGARSEELRDTMGVGMIESNDDDEPVTRRLGTYTESREEIDVLFRQFLACARVEPSARRQQGLPLSEESELLIPHANAWLFPRWLQQVDQQVLHRRAVRTMISLERYRITHGHYPDRLDELPREALGQNVLDPFSGRPFGYRLTDPQSDRIGRGYILWSVGADGEDNGGKASRNWDVGLRPAGAGQDVIMNDSHW